MNDFRVLHCLIDECKNQVRTRGWCNTHYERWRRLGDPTVASLFNGKHKRHLRKIEGISSMSPALDRFLFGITVLDSGCWEWMGAKCHCGYAQFIDRGKRVYVHRWAYEWFIGKIPDGLSLDHLCRNPACCNPVHLEPVTHKENVLRGISFAAKNSKKTHCQRGHEYSGDNVGFYKNGGRYCRECHKLNTRERRRKIKESV